MSRAVEVEASAPGKLYLFGEYAVLAGGWSVVAAVDRRVTSRRWDEAADYKARGLETDDVELVEAVVEEVESERGRSFEPGHFSTDATAMYASGTKLGLGSSAASAVALAAAGLSDGSGGIAESGFRQRVLRTAEGAHEAFQRGIGSGASIPAAALGGVLACRRRSPTAEFKELETDFAPESSETTGRFELGGLELPSAIEVRAYWLGRPASTPGFVRKVLRRVQIAPADVYRRLRRIARVAERAIEACRGDSASEFLEAVAEGDAAMGALGEECEMPVVVDRHWNLREAAESRAIAVKPSGAGGGDFSLAVGPADADWNGFERALSNEILRISLEFGAEGVR